MSIQAIETHYAGCRFRSRLEARWAVFFDTLGMEWLYEPQGYEIPRPDGSTFRYLPDFWLPQPEIWVEVKGRLDHRALQDLLLAASAAGLPPEYGQGRGGPHAFWPGRHRILMLGEVPRETTNWAHFRLDVLTGDLITRTLATFARLKNGRWTTFACCELQPLNDILLHESTPEHTLLEFTAGRQLPYLMTSPHVQQAYRAASGARFEHGESGGGQNTWDTKGA